MVFSVCCSLPLCKYCDFALLRCTGKGKFVSASTGYIYDGMWKDGLKDGQGLFLFPSGDYFVGRWRLGTLDGPVEYHFPEGSPWLDPEY